MSDNWQVIIHMKAKFKIVREIEPTTDVADDMAYEQAHHAFQYGTSITDNRGVVTIYPPEAIEKIKIVPPGIEVKSTQVDAR